MRTELKFVIDDVFPAWCNRAAFVFRSVFSERAEVLGLNWAEGVILLKMSAGHNTLADLSRHLEHSHPAILRHIDKLEELGFVERTAHPDDRRVKILVMTDKGHQTTKALQDMARSYSKEIEEKFGRDRVAAATALLKDIVAEYSNIDFMGCPKGKEE